MRNSLLSRVLSVALAPTLFACATPKVPITTRLDAPVATTLGVRNERALDTWANGAVFYEVFVRSFRDSNGDGKGDLQGLIAKLDYLNDGDPATHDDLGVDALWLMPVFASPSYHGYDTTDYENINPDYGTNADFAKLCEEAHKRGMKIVVDLVLNHSGRDHPWFIESASSPTSPKRDWYVWSATKLVWGQPWNENGNTWHEKNGAYYYGLFWEGMPDLNYRTPAVREEAKRLAALWLSRGVDGFRLDATRHLIETGPGQTGQNDTEETHQFLRELSAAVRAVRPDAALIGENWTETPIIARYYGSTEKVRGGDELPLNFDFPLASKILQGARTGEAGLIVEKLQEVERTYPSGATDVPFLTNHDMKRAASYFDDDVAKQKSAAAVLLTLPGTPFLYYGEEVGLLNGPGDNDESKRTPMPWDATEGGGFSAAKPWYAFAPGKERANVATQGADAASLLAHYRALIGVRHASAALSKGALSLLYPSSGAVLAYVRTHEKERVLVVHNLGEAAVGVALPVEASGAAPLFATKGASVGVAAGAAELSLPAHATVIARLE